MEGVRRLAYRLHLDAQHLGDVLRREAALRKCPATLAGLVDPGSDPIELITGIQRQVVAESPELSALGADDAVQLIRCAQSLYPRCPEMQEIPHYVKFNRSGQGTVAEGDPVPVDAPLLLSLGCEPVALAAYRGGGGGRPLVIAAGSIT